MIVTTNGTSCITLSAVSSNLRSHNEYVEALLKLVNYQPWGFRFPTDDKFNFPRGSIHGFVTKFLQLLQLWGGCSPGGRAGYLQIGRLVVQSLSVPFLRGILTLMQPSDCECLQMMDRRSADILSQSFCVSGGKCWISESCCRPHCLSLWP